MRPVVNVVLYFVRALGCQFFSKVGCCKKKKNPFLLFHYHLNRVRWRGEKRVPSATMFVPTANPENKPSPNACVHILFSDKSILSGRQVQRAGTFDYTRQLTIRMPQTGCSVSDMTYDSY